MKPETIKLLIQAAKAETVSDTDEDFCAIDYAGGNFDDAWNYGSEEGETFLARQILQLEGIEYR